MSIEVAQLQPQVLRGEDLGFQQLSTLHLPPEPEWIVKGLLAPGNLSGLYGLFKTGKTTFFLAMIAAAQRGRTFLGMATRDPGPVLMLVEDNLSSFQSYARQLDVRLDGIHVLSRRALARNVAGFGWPEIATAVGQEASAQGARIVYCDLNPWAQLEPERENDAGAVQQAVDPLLALTGDDIGVWVSLQANKVGGIRGSTAWGANLDIIVELARPRDDVDDPRRLPRSARVVRGQGRWEAIPESLVANLVERKRYELMGQTPRAAVADLEETLVIAQARSLGSVTREDVRDVLDCSESKAKSVISRLERTGRLAKVEGTGVGRARGRWEHVEREVRF